MGPALLEDTKAGRFQAKYDQAFLAGETNCDIINMLLEPTSGKYSQHSVEDCTVGRNTWTFPKTGGMSRPQDVSSWYKTEPAKCNQRTSFLETGMRITHSHEASGVRFNAVAPPKTLVIGKPIVMGLDVVGATRGVAVTLRVQKVDSRDKKIKGTQADLWSYSVNVKGSQNVRQNVPLAKLAAALGETRSFRLLWSASVDGSKEGFMHQSTILLTPPPMRISSAQIQVGQVAKATVQWENPLPIALKCKFQYSIGDSGRNFPEVTFNVGKGGVLNHVIVVKTSKAGKIQGQATLSCDNLDEITGQFYVTAQPPPPRRLHRERRPGLSGRNKIGPERTNRLQPGTQVTAGARQSDRSSGTRTGHTNPAPQQPRRRRPGVPAQRFRQQNTDLAPMKATPLDPVSDVDQMEYEVAELL
jgi:hypothetical protein